MKLKKEIMKSYEAGFNMGYAAHAKGVKDDYGYMQKRRKKYIDSITDKLIKP